MDREPALHVIQRIDSVQPMARGTEIGVTFTSGTNLQVNVTFTREAAQTLMQGLARALSPKD